MIKDIFKSSSESFNRDQLVAVVDSVFKELKETTLPALAITDSIIAKTEPYELYDKHFSKKVTGYRGELVRFMRETIEARVKDKDEFIDIIEKVFTNKVNREQLTYDRLNIIQYVKALQFASIFTRMFLLSCTKIRLGDPYKPVHKKELEFVMSFSNQEAFPAIFDVMVLKPKELHKRLESITGISYDPDTENLIARDLGAAKANPVGLNYVPVVSDIALYFGRVYNRIVNYKYELAKEELERIKIELYYLEQEAAGASGEELEKIKQKIEYYTKTIVKLRKYVEEREEDAKPD